MKHQTHTYKDRRIEVPLRITNAKVLIVDDHLIRIITEI